MSDPRILVFACNWCSYAGADTAGVSRLSQSPHFRLLRVMCSGRVHPAHVLRAFARGADGVMVSGCHFGDCHYRFGNYRAVEQYERTRALVRLLGLEESRLRLEWISAAEGIRFAEIINEFVAEVGRAGPSPIAPPVEAETASPPAAGALPPAGTLALAACLECGRCTAVCPIAPHQRFSPRRMVSRAIAAGLPALADDRGIWACLTCRGCHEVCPMGVDFDEFVLAARASVARPERAEVETEALLREEAPAPGRASLDLAPCSHGGVFEQVSLLSARPGLRQARLDWLDGDLAWQPLAEGEAAPGRDLLFVGCSPYFAAYFGGETGAGLTGSLRACVRLLNRAGITPALLANERCCGYHLRLAGRAAAADELERLVVGQLRASGARRVITQCPECLVALRAAARRLGAPLEILHLSQVLPPEAAARAGAAAPAPATPAEAGEAPGPRRVTYQDPCRLGRHARLFDEPRALLAARPATELLEMPRSREAAVCCGNTGWLNCNAATQRFQTQRLAEAAATGAEALVTACPGCYIHLRCAQTGLAGDGAGTLPILDLWSLLAGEVDRTEEDEHR